ncbi:MAG TPA: sugar ABC transporter permease, partial [Acetobacteraceae bacterium]|nr:sugar ABC transporter permease [Acetobacteraceae bacterium]
NIDSDRLKQPHPGRSEGQAAGLAPPAEDRRLVRPRIGIADRDGVVGTIMLAPAVIYVVALVGVPFFLAIGLSLSDATVGNPTIHDFVGLGNFISVIHETAFRFALRNSIIVTAACLVLLTILTIIEVEILAREFRGKRLAQILLILPWAMPVALAAVGWLWLLDSEFSPIDWILRAVHLLGPGTIFGPAMNSYYLGREWLGLAVIVVINVWRLLPLSTVIVLAGRTAIPRERFEQATLDGAGYFRILFQITIPGLATLLIVAVLFTVLVIFGDMTVVALTTRGGPGYTTEVLPYWAYLKGIQGGALSQGAAIALFLFPVLLAGSILALRMAYRNEDA